MSTGICTATRIVAARSFTPVAVGALPRTAGDPRRRLRHVAGGQVRLREPDARITAIDISETSLRHTRDLQRKYNLENLELHQLAIEHVRELGRTFDAVVATGVLHHLPDPDLGLRALHDVLRPQGAMHLMVYAPYGRAGIYMMQEYCRLLGVSRSDRSCAISVPRSRPCPTTTHRRRDAGGQDFRHPDALADALLHPIDRAYTVPQLYDWLDRCGMCFGRWVEQAPYLAQCGVMAKTKHAARLASLPAPPQHAAVEFFRGTMVRHNLIAYRDDRAGASQPITFVGADWRHTFPSPCRGPSACGNACPPGVSPS